MDSPVEADGEGRAGGGGFRGSPTGPTVLPGTYHLQVNASGHSMTGTIAVEGDPRTAFSDADRRARQSMLIDLYNLEKTLGAARKASRTLGTQAETLKKAVGRQAAGLETLSAHLSKIEREVNAEMNAASSLSRAVDGYSGLPTADQKRQGDWVFEDATASVAALNTVIQTEAPAAYGELLKEGSLPARQQPIPAPVRK
jgi:hypothetical protein